MTGFANIHPRLQHRLHISLTVVRGGSRLVRAGYGTLNGGSPVTNLLSPRGHQWQLVLILFFPVSLAIPFLSELSKLSPSSGKYYDSEAASKAPPPIAQYIDILNTHTDVRPVTVVSSNIALPAVFYPAKLRTSQQLEHF